MFLTPLSIQRRLKIEKLQSSAKSAISGYQVDSTPPPKEFKLNIDRFSPEKLDTPSRN